VLSLDVHELLAHVTGQFHLDGATSDDDGSGLDGAEHNHNSVIERAFSLFDVLGGSTTENDGDGLGGRAFSEHVKSLGSELDLLEFTALTENLSLDSINGSLDNTTGGLGNTVEIVELDTSSAENLSVSEVLSSEITDR